MNLDEMNDIKNIPRCLDEVVDEEEDDVVPLCSSPNLAAASAMIA